MKRAAAYARVSTFKQSETSIKAQFEAIEQYAKDNDIQIVAKYQDKITASGSKERPGFKQMLEDAKEGKFDMILVFKYDRFERNSVEDQLIIKELESRGIWILSVKEPLDPSTPAGRLQRWILSGLNQFYLENLRDEIITKTRKVAEKGYFLGGIPPYGYKVVEVKDPEASRKRKKYIIDETKAPIVREIFKRYANGEGYAEIVEYLNKNQIPAPKKDKWTRSTIYEILRNEKYAGIYVYNKGYKNNYHANRDDVIKIEGVIPAIVDKETFEKVRERFKKNKTRYRGGNHRIYILKDILFCGDCGAKMEGSGGKNPKYVCSRWKRQKDVQHVSVGALKIESFVLGYIERVLEDVDFEKLAQEYNIEAARRDRELRRKLEELETKRSEIEIRIDRAAEAILNGVLVEKMKEETDRLVAELETINEKIAELKSSKRNYITVEEVEEKFKRYREALKKDAYTQHKLLLEMLEKVVVYPSGYIEITPKE